jgi:hypothetical protein
MAEEQRHKVIEAARALNYLVGDLHGGWVSYRLFSGNEAVKSLVPSELHSSLTRMSLSWMVLAVTKIDEICSTYHSIMPSSLKSELRLFRKDVRGYDFRRFRNKLIGHVIDDDTKRPLSQDELKEELRRVFGDSTDPFVRWVKKPAQSAGNAGVIRLIEELRDALIGEHKITLPELDVESKPCGHYRN